MGLQQPVLLHKLIKKADVLIASGQTVPNVVADPKNPALPSPNAAVLTQSSVGQATSYISSSTGETAANPWFGPSLSTAMFDAMNEAMQIGKQTQLDSSLAAIKVGQEQFKVGVASAQEQAQITQNQAYQQMTQAIQGFFSAGVSLNAARTTLANQGAAAREVEANITAKQNALSELKGVQASPDATELQKQQATPEKIQTAEKQLEQLKINRDNDTRQKTQERDQVTQNYTQAANSMLQGASSAVGAALDMSTSQLQLQQGLNNAMKESFDQWEKLLEQNRDSAGSFVDNIQNQLQQVLASNAQNYSSRGPS